MTGRDRDDAPVPAREAARAARSGERLAVVEAELVTVNRDIADLRRLVADERREARAWRADMRHSLRVVQDHITRETAGRRAIARVARIACALLAAGGAMVAIWKGLNIRQ